MLLLYCTLHLSTGEEEQVPQASAVLYFTPRYCGRRAGPTCYCCTVHYTPVLVRKSRSLKLLLYSTLHPGIVEGEQVQHVTAVLYITSQYCGRRAGPTCYCCTVHYTPVLGRESRSNMLLLYCTLHPSTGEEEQVPQASAVLYFTYKYYGRRAGPTCYCCTVHYIPVLVRKSRSLKLLLYSTLHISIVEGEQVQHVTAVLYITSQYW